MVRRPTLKIVELPDGRDFYAKYKRVTKQTLPANVKIRKTYRQIPGP